MSFFNNKVTVRPEDHILPKSFQFGTKENIEMSEVMEDLAFFGTCCTAASSAFRFGCQVDDYLAKRKAKNRSSWFWF